MMEEGGVAGYEIRRTGGRLGRDYTARRSLVDAFFWLPAACALYAYVGYPAILAVASALRPRREASVEASADGLPFVSVVVPSFNEAAVLSRRLRNLQELRYPADRLQIIVGSDGSTDDTASVADAAADPRIHFVSVATRGGKTSLLNRMVAASSAEIVVFTDVNSLFEKDALRHLVQPFADPRIGCVTGELVYVNGNDPGVRAGEGLYWRMENVIKEMESRFGGTLVATGAIYALRRALWRPLPAGISDDSVTPLMTLAAGYRVVVEKRALAFELAASHLSEEFDRKARMVTRQLGAHRHVGYFLKPFRPLLAFRLASHKILRWLVPFFLIATLAANLFLLHRPFYRVTFVAACVGGLLFALGYLALRRGRALPAPIRLWVYFCVVNAAALTGVLDFLRGRHRTVWAVSPSTR
jgi:cellulose synthase/poly-beta-1,6-N-acetylglucosamine synthase-like glycosyltransferase